MASTLGHIDVVDGDQVVWAQEHSDISCLEDVLVHRVVDSSRIDKQVIAVVFHLGGPNRRVNTGVYG